MGDDDAQGRFVQCPGEPFIQCVLIALGAVSARISECGYP